jgi:hypothetical protein
MESIMHQIALDTMKNTERIVKEAIEQNHNYLIIKKEYSFEGSTFKCNYIYQGFDSLIGLEYFEKQGYEIYDLTKARDFLRNNKMKEYSGRGEKLDGDCRL